MSHQCSQNQQLQRQVDKATESVDMQWTHTRSGHMPWRAASRTGVVAGHEKRRVFHLVARWPSRQCRPVVHLRHRCRPREIVMQHNKCDAKEGHMAPRFHHRRLQHHLRRTHRHTHTHTTMASVQSSTKQGSRNHGRPSTPRVQAGAEHPPPPNPLNSKVRPPAHRQCCSFRESFRITVRPRYKLNFGAALHCTCMTATCTDVTSACCGQSVAVYMTETNPLQQGWCPRCRR
jgi:hypothetical protein